MIEIEVGKYITDKLVTFVIEKAFNGIKNVNTKVKCNNIVKKLKNQVFYINIDSRYLDDIDKLFSGDLSEKLVEMALHAMNYSKSDVENVLLEKISQTNVKIPNKDKLITICYEIYTHCYKKLNTIDDEYRILCNNIITNLRDNIDNKNNNLLTRLDDLERLINLQMDKHELKEESNTFDLLSAINKYWLKIDIKSQIKDNDTLRMYKEVENIYFRGTISKLIRIFMQTWKSILLELFDKNTLNPSHGLYDKLTQLNSAKTYDKILEYAKNIIYGDKIEQYSLNLKKIDTFISNVSYKKVFLVTGDMGSGKTFFVNNFIKECVNVPEVKLIPLYISYEKVVGSRCFDDVIVDTFNQVLNLSVSDISQVNNSLKQLNCKMCIIIDDIQKIYFSYTDGPINFSNILNCVKSFTIYDDISWLFTVSTHEYFIFEGNSDFINHYCFGAQFNGSGTGFGIGKQSFDLDEYNSRKSIPKNILKTYNITLIQDTNKSNLSNVFLDISPLYSHILGSNFEGSKNLFYCETYFEYIEIIVQLIENKLKNSTESTISQENKDRLLDILSNTSNLVHTENELNDVGALNLNKLVFMQLMSIDEIKDIPTFSIDRSSRKYTYRIEVYWAVMLIIHYVKINLTYIDIIKKGLSFPTNFKDVFFSCYIMYVYQCNTNIVSILSSLYEHNIFYYPMLHSRKIDTNFQQHICQFLKSALVSDPRTIYSFLYFLYYSSISIKDKLELVVISSKGIVDCDLLITYENTLCHIISPIKNEHLLINEMLELIRININELNYINGYTCAHKFNKIINKHVDRNNISPNLDAGSCDVIKCLEHFILENSIITHTIQSDYNKNKTFVDYFVRAVFENILSISSLEKVYDYMNAEGLFNHPNNIGDFFKRNLICAAGNVYAHDLSVLENHSTYHESYINFICIKSKSNLLSDRIESMLLILNSTKNSNEQVSSNILPQFELLWEDPEVKEVVKDFSETIKILQQINNSNPI